MGGRRERDASRRTAAASSFNRAVSVFGDIGVEKLLLLLCVVLVLFGAKRPPEIGASMGRGVREFKRSLGSVSDTLADGLGLSGRREISRAAPEGPPPGDHFDSGPSRLVG
jgi:sec-independent protein translocase protein TatA